MQRDLKLFFIAIGLPALVLALAGMRLVYIEHNRANHTRRVPERVVKVDDSFRNKHLEVKRPPQKSEKKEVIKVEKGDIPKAEKKDSVKSDRKELAKVNKKGTPAPKGDKKELAKTEKKEILKGGKKELQGKIKKNNFQRDKARKVPQVFSGEVDATAERTMWIGGCVIGLLFLSLVSGAWLLARSARTAREDALRKTDFLANISHELKTPLTTICICAELARSEGLDPERRDKALSAISSEAERLKALILNALDFSRLEKGRRKFFMEECDVCDIVKESVEAMRERLRGCKLLLPKDSLKVMADIAALRQVIVILLDNAAKYAPNSDVDIAVEKTNSEVVLKVMDRGCGVEGIELKMIFERFYRSHNSTTSEAGGSGLGLAIAKELVKGMGGAIDAKKRAGGGLIFTVRLKG